MKDLFEGEPVTMLSHCDAQRMTHAAAPESMLIIGWKDSPFHVAQPLEHIDVIEPIEMTPSEFTDAASHRYVANKIRVIDATRSGAGDANR